MIHVVKAFLIAAALLLTSPAAALMALAPGDRPPPFELRDLDGRNVALASLEGSPAAVVFWSTWSPRSGEALVDFVRLHEAYAGRGLRVVAVNIDGESLGPAQLAAIREYAAARGLPFPVLIDEGLATFAAWGVMAHPTEVLLDAGGRIVHVLPGYPLSLRDELTRIIEGLLGIAPPPVPKKLPAVGYIPKAGALQQYHLGRRHIALGDFERARRALRTASVRDPDFFEPAILAARVSLALDDLEDVEAFVRAVRAEQVNRPDLRFLIGALLLRKGDLETAKRAFEALRERHPGESWGSWGLGLTALARGDEAGALVFMREAHDWEPECPEAEAALRDYMRRRWMRRETVQGEDELVVLFPSLAELRDRYRRLFGVGGGTGR